MVSANTVFTALMGLAMANLATASLSNRRVDALQARAEKYTTRSVMWRRGDDGALLRRDLKPLEPRKCYHSCWRKDKQKKSKSKKNKKPKASKKIKAKKGGKKSKKEKKQKKEKKEKEEDEEEDSE